MSDEILQDHSYGYDLYVKRVDVDYAIRSDYLDRTKLTEELGIRPSRAWAKGEHFDSVVPETAATIRARGPRIRPWGLWAIDSKSLQTKNPEEHLLYLLNLLEPKNERVQRYLNDGRYAVRFHVWWEPLDCHGGYRIASHVMAACADLCHYFEFAFISAPSSE